MILNTKSYESILKNLKLGVRVINVSRGPLIEEAALLKGLSSGVINSAALDVFENEPLKLAHPILEYGRCILGSHNASNTFDAVEKDACSKKESLNPMSDASGKRP